MSEMSEALLDSKLSLPNKLLQDDGRVTDITGKTVLDTVPAYDAKVALPNKFLNADGTYSTLNEIFAEVADVDLFVPVQTLPETGDPRKIYLVPNGKGTFDEYHYDETLNKWDPFGILDVSNLVTKTEFDGALEIITEHFDKEIKKIVPLMPFPEEFNTDGTTYEFIKSIYDYGPSKGAMYLGGVAFTDMPVDNLYNAEVKVEVYADGVYYLTMTSGDVKPYVWTCNSFDFRGWEADSIQAAKDYTDEQIEEKITQVLGGEY